MKKWYSPLIATLIVGTCVVATPLAANAAGVGNRLAGEDRILTSIEISKEAFPDSASVVFLARSDSFPDALAAGALTGGPILLVPRTGNVPSELIREIDRLDPDDVVALGGTLAIDDDVLEQAAGSRSSRRLAGKDRFTTSVLISKEVPPGDKIYLARADNFPDALAAGSLTDGSILLVPATGVVPDSILAEIRRRNPSEVVALGGTVAISSSVLKDAAQGRTTSRLSGDTRVETAVAISRAAFPDGASQVFLAVQSNFPDALSAGALTTGPILLVPSCGALPAAVTTEIKRLRATQVTALGSENVVCAQMLDAAVDAAAPGVTFLTDVELISRDMMYRVRTGTESIDGQGFPQSVGFDPTGDALASAVHDLGRDFTTFKATVGVNDLAYSDVQFTWTIRDDTTGTQLATGTSSIGATTDVEVDVTNLLRLRIEVIQTGGPDSPCCGSDHSLVFGTARLIPAGGSDDAPAPTDDVPAGPLAYLNGRSQIYNDMYRVRGGTESVNGNGYVESVGLDPIGDKLSSAVYDLGRDFTTFATTVGVNDLAYSDVQFTWTIRDDTSGTQLATGTSSIGATTDVEVDVTNLLRLRIELVQTGGADSPCCGSDHSLVFGSARLILPGNSDTAPAPTKDAPSGQFAYVESRSRIYDDMYRVRGGTESINGDSYVESVGFDPIGDTLSSAVYDLGRDFATFKATVGVNDTAGSTVSFTWTIRDDTTGAQLATGTSSIGATTDVEVDVTNVLRLRIELVQTGGPDSPCCGSAHNLAFGTARLILPGGTDTAPQPG